MLAKLGKGGRTFWAEGMAGGKALRLREWKAVEGGGNGRGTEMKLVEAMTASLTGRLLQRIQGT